MTATAAGTELQEQQGELQAGNKQPSAAEAAETAQNQALVCVPRTSSPHAHSSSNSSSRAPSSTTPAALYRYQHYASTLGRELALLVLCHGSAGLAAAVRVSLRLTRVLGLQLQHWLSHSQLAKAAADALVRALRALRTLLQQHVALPLGRLLTQLVWVQVQLSTDDVLDEGVALAARLNSCVSLLFGSIRLRSHSCLQLAAPSRQPVLAPEFSLSSPSPSPTRLPGGAGGGLRGGTLQQQQGQEQQEQQQQALLRAASSPTPRGSPRLGARAVQGLVAAAAAAATAAVGGGGGGGREQQGAGSNSSKGSSSRHAAGGANNISNNISVAASTLWSDLSEPQRASVARALRFSQHPGSGSSQGLSTSTAADSEVHVLCSSELKAAILSFLQAHSKRNGSEFVLLRNFQCSAPPTPRADEEQQQEELAAAAAEAAAGTAAGGQDAATTASAAAGAAGLDAAAVARSGCSSDVPGVSVVVGFDGGDAAVSVSVLTEEAAGASKPSSGSGGNSSSSDGGDSAHTGSAQQQPGVCLPPVRVTALPEDADQQQQQQVEMEEEGSSKQGDRMSLSLAQAWDQLKQAGQGQESNELQQQTHRSDHTADVAPTHSSDTDSQNGGGGSGSSNGCGALEDAASLLAAAAEALGDQQQQQQLLGSPQKCDTSPQRSHNTTAARAAAAIAAVTAQHTGSTASASASVTTMSSSSASKVAHNNTRYSSSSGSFVSAADKFRSLAASAAAATGADKDGSDTDPCGKPLKAFSRSSSSRTQQGQQPSSPTRWGTDTAVRRSGSSSARVTLDGSGLSAGSSLHQQQQYAVLFPPGSRSFEALSLRKSGGPSPIGTPACHSRNAAQQFVVKKKLPAAPFSLSASLPLPLDATQLD